MTRRVECPKCGMAFYVFEAPENKKSVVTDAGYLAIYHHKPECDERLKEKSKS